MKHKIPRLMIAGTNSGCGKTTITCGILAALKQMQLSSASCKCGPDYIDPMFHSMVFDIPSQNLDLFFTNPEETKYLLSKNSTDKDITVIEGVMGFYDGMQMDSTKASSYELAAVTETPVVLVINCKGMALSVVPLIKGFLEFRADNTVQGVILNGVSEMTGKQLTKIIEEQLPVKVYGCIPYLQEFTLASRHLGLITPYELDGMKESLEQLGIEIQKHVDMEGLLQLAATAPDIEDDIPESLSRFIPSNVGDGINVAVAFDKAFCFYYKENLELLKEVGCNLIYFSPMEDKKIPENADVVLLGGGYPEIYAKELSENVSMRNDIKRRIEGGLFCIAECGGFMYLHEEMESDDAVMYPMAGVIKGKCVNKNKLVRFGYISVESNSDNSILQEGDEVRAHEFHYWDSTNNGESFLAKKPSGKRSWTCCHVGNGVMGYPHFYYYSNPEFIYRILEQVRK